MNHDLPIYDSIDINSYREHLPVLFDSYVKKRHEKFTISLRKSKRIDNFSKFRGIFNSSSHLSLNPLPDCFGVKEKLTDLEKLIFLKDILEKNTGLTYQALVYIKNEFEKNQEYLIAALANLGFIDTFNEYLNFSVPEELARLSANLICNVTAGPHEYIVKIIQIGALNNLIQLINHKFVKTAENAIWAISNIIVDSEEYFGLLIDMNIIRIVHQFIKGLEFIQKKIGNVIGRFFKSVSLYSAHLCKEYVIIILNCACIVLKYVKSYELFSAFSYLLKVDDNRALFHDMDLIEIILKHSNNRSKMKAKSLAIGRLLLGTEQEIREMIQKGALNSLEKVIKSDDKASVKNALWALSLIADSEANYEYLINDEVLQKSFTFLINNDEELRLEASYIFVNITLKGKSKSIRKFKEIGLFYTLPQMLMFPEPNFLKNILRAILEITNYSTIISENDDWKNSIQKLTFHINQEISQISEEILQNFENESNLFMYAEYYDM